MDKDFEQSVDEYGFGKLDTWFIDKYLRHDEETLEQAKIRIKNQQKISTENKNS